MSLSSLADGQNGASAIFSMPSKGVEDSFIQNGLCLILCCVEFAFYVFLRSVVVYDLLFLNGLNNLTLWSEVKVCKREREREI